MPGTIGVFDDKGRDTGMLMNSTEYLKTVEEVKQEIRAAQYRAAVHVNTELTMLYYSIGTVIN